MNTRPSARIAGVLLLCATAASLVDRALIAPILDGPDYLASVAASPERVVVGALFQVVAGLTSAAIATAFYPVVRRYAAGLAVGSVAFRVIEGTLYLIGALGTLLVVTLAQHVAAAGADVSGAATSGQLVLSLRDRAGEVGALCAYVGATLYYVAFLRHRLLPRWLSVWGLAGAGLGLVAGVLAFCGAIGFMSPPQVALNVPIGLNEIVLAIWLLARGFNRPVPDGAPSPAPASALRQ